MRLVSLTRTLNAVVFLLCDEDSPSEVSVANVSHTTVDFFESRVSQYPVAFPVFELDVAKCPNFLSFPSSLAQGITGVGLFDLLWK